MPSLYSGRLFSSTQENTWFFDPKKIMDRKEWAKKLMDSKGVACKDDEWYVGTVANVTVDKLVIKKDNFTYAAILSSSPTPNNSKKLNHQAQILSDLTMKPTKKSSTNPTTGPSHSQFFGLAPAPSRGLSRHGEFLSHQHFPLQDTGIVFSGATYIYIVP